MNTCPNCGKVAGLHSSILQGCMCQYSMQAPAQRTWVGLTLQDREALRDKYDGWTYPGILVDAISDMLKEKNT